MEPSKENMFKILYGKKFFLKSFLISVVFYIFSAIIILFGHQTFVQFAHTVFGLNDNYYTLVLVLFMGMWKILIIQLTLVPFIALYFLEKCMGKEEK